MEVNEDPHPLCFHQEVLFSTATGLVRHVAGRDEGRADLFLGSDYSIT